MVEVLLRQQEDWKSRDRTLPYFVFFFVSNSNGKIYQPENATVTFQLPEIQVTNHTSLTGK